MCRIHFRVKRVLSTKFIILLCGFLVLYLITNRRNSLSSQAGGPIPSDLKYKSDKTSTFQKIGYRSADSESPLHDILQRRERLRRQLKNPFFRAYSFIRGLLVNPGSGRENREEEFELLTNWNNTTLLTQCSYLIENIYQNNPSWTNEEIVKFHNNDNVDDLMMSLMGERVRIYNYCFTHGNLNTLDVLKTKYFKKQGIDPWDYQSRTFPFFKENIDPENYLLWPNIYDLSLESENKLLPKPSFKTGNRQFNLNFLQYWKMLGKGRGIVTTLPIGDIKLFYKQLKVLDYLNNTLPIQIVTTGGASVELFIEELKSYSKSTHQKILLIDTSPMLNTSFASLYIRFFSNKWISILFNTFEEMIFMDVDVVPFVNPNEFFEIDGYKETGIFMYKDRALLNEHTFQYCIDTFRGLEPSMQENELLSKNHVLDRLLRGSSDKSKSAKDQTGQQQTFNSFFIDQKLHHVDSGLVVIDKKRKFDGILMSFLLNIDWKTQRCVYGDKEVFWLGHLFAGSDYAIDATYAGLLGPIGKDDDEATSSTRYHICSAQISHNDGERLMWANGGLKTCKLDNAAEADFDANPDYFSSRYNDKETLEQMYSSALGIDAMIIPDPEVDPWLQIQECQNYMYCAFVTTDVNDSPLDAGSLVKFKSPSLISYNKISNLWNDAVIS
ncbi:hypothetical protein KAFR_0K01240 [Kazachstania africana CBS 2517]|uniref:Alpha-1,3-mannosyltransferase n=1 Tax=Kazachstania africana (strain ATCC 22294 / BCRC 22015 / CBS 2517 / CECT 1963 / NBRC 1671 / NRRL Y-8276) TaxID=1071382 RepID=H2B1H9_KAZAF|nr:hypothetical protein KAFR_0K01240 [Kazachstania africana CBS 2517]CCF60479.1 hypothetical protein KAFR_0K01240 [Kazachstania africana CBS 2517]